MEFSLGVILRKIKWIIRILRGPETRNSDYPGFQVDGKPLGKILKVGMDFLGNYSHRNLNWGIGLEGFGGKVGILTEFLQTDYFS